MSNTTTPGAFETATTETLHGVAAAFLLVLPGLETEAKCKVRSAEHAARRAAAREQFADYVRCLDRVKAELARRG